MAVPATSAVTQSTKPKPKPVMFADVTFTDADGHTCERYYARVSRKGPCGTGRLRKGWRWYRPYDKQEKCFLAEPIGDVPSHKFGQFFARLRTSRDGRRLYAWLPGSFIAGEVYDWLAETPVDWYEQRTGAKGKARWERILERRKLKAVERKLDAARGAA